jgi:hypothetical protein
MTISNEVTCQVHSGCDFVERFILVDKAIAITNVV